MRVGLDIGSTTIKCVVLNDADQIRPPGVAQAVNRGGGSGLMLHRLGLRLHAQALGGLVP